MEEKSLQPPLVEQGEKELAFYMVRIVGRDGETSSINDTRVREVA